MRPLPPVSIFLNSATNSGRAVGAGPAAFPPKPDWQAPTPANTASVAIRLRVAFPARTWLIAAASSSPRLRQYLAEIDPKLSHHGKQDLVLVFEMMQNDFDLLLILHVDLQIVLSARFGVPSDDVLPDHDQRHEKDLDKIGEKQPEHKPHGGIELQL